MCTCVPFACASACVLHVYVCVYWQSCVPHPPVPLWTWHFPYTAQGTLKSDSAGLISGLADKARQLKHGTGADDHPVVVVEFDTGYAVVRGVGVSDTR